MEKDAWPGGTGQSTEDGLRGRFHEIIVDFPVQGRKAPSPIGEPRHQNSTWGNLGRTPHSNTPPRT
jgi:hypothetical protein